MSSSFNHGVWLSVIQYNKQKSRGVGKKRVVSEQLWRKKGSYFKTYNSMRLNFWAKV